MQQNEKVVIDTIKPLDPVGVRGDEPIDDMKESRFNIESHAIDEMPVVTDIGPKECMVNVPMAECKHCGYAGPFHIPAFPACDEDDELFDAHVECPICECHGPAACHDSDNFCSTRNAARSLAVRHWNRPSAHDRFELATVPAGAVFNGFEGSKPVFITKPEPIALGMTALQAIRRLNELNDILNHAESHIESIRAAQRERTQIFEAFK